MHRSENPFPAVDAHGSIAKGVSRFARLETPGGAEVVEQGGYLYINHLSPPDGTSIIDVRDPGHSPVSATIIRRFWGLPAR